MKIWRVSNYTDLSGIGGKYSQGRWNHLGTEIVYCSDHPSTCLLELLVRFDPELTPDTYQLIEIDVPDNLTILKPTVKKDWREDILYTRDLWEEFSLSDEAAIMQVPSAIIPQAFHYLINPRHMDIAKIKISASYQNLLDERFYI